MTESMIDRLAKAVRSYSWSLMCHGDPEAGVRKYHVFGPDGGHWRDATEALFETEAEAQAYVDRMNVRAVLNILKEPTKEMISDGATAVENSIDHTSDSYSSYGVYDVAELAHEAWSAMISHILKESESK